MSLQKAPADFKTKKPLYTFWGCIYAGFYPA